MQESPFCTPAFLFFAWNARRLVRAIRYPSYLLFGIAVRQSAITEGLLWLDLAEGRLRLDRLWTQRLRIDSSSPDAWASFLARQETRWPAVLRCSGPWVTLSREREGTPTGGCVADRLRPFDRHRGRDGRGLEDSRSQENYHGEHRLLQEVRQRVPRRDRDAERPGQGRPRRPRDEPE